MSVDQHGVPAPPPSKKKPQVNSPEQILAARIVDHYRKIFDYLDYNPVDDLINADELMEAFRDYHWPKYTNEALDDRDYAAILIKKYDKSGKDALNFVEFCELMEDLWNSADLITEKKCNLAFRRAKDVFQRLFKWLDRDNDNMVDKEDIMFGVSRIMVRDADVDEINKVFAKYDTEKTGKLDYERLILAISNGMLDKTLRDPLINETL